MGWHDVSWTKCLKPPTYDDEVKQFLRRRIQPQMRAALRDRCERCGSSEDLEVNHLDPTFDEIYQQVRHHFTQSEIDSWAYHDGWANARFALPERHRVLVAFEELHRGVRLETLCRRCHRQTTTRRSSS